MMSALLKVIIEKSSKLRVLLPNVETLTEYVVLLRMEALMPK
jgi:hypothetical protein